MIRKIGLTNFLSYCDSVVDLDGSQSILILGDNGNGKSTLLEALVYSLYGVGRYPYLSDYARWGGDGSFEVSVELGGVPGDGDVAVFRRGRDAKGRGYADAMINGDSVASGNDVTGYAVDVLGMDADTFLLTAFYGLGDSKHADTLLNVEPSTCLETMQKLAKVAVFKPMHDIAKSRGKSLQKELDLLRSKLEGYRESFQDPEELKSDLESAVKEIDSTSRAMVSARQELDGLLTEENRYVALSTERSAVEHDLEAIRGRIRELDDEIADTVSEMDRVKAEGSTAIKRKKELKSEIDAADIDAWQSRFDEIGPEFGGINSMKALKSAAADLDIGDDITCPLCSSPISKDVVLQWRDDVERLERELESLVEEQETVVESIKGYKDTVKAFEACVNRIDRARSTWESESKLLKKLRRDREVACSAEVEKQARLESIESEFGDDYEDLTEKLEAASTRVSTLSLESGRLSTVIATIREQTDEGSRVAGLIRDAEKRIKAITLDLEAVEILTKSFSRYGIPFDLMRSLSEEIHKLATDVYHEFGNGEVVIEDVEGARPGIRFVLVDQKGRRPFSGLSYGERAMFFVAVRVAISQIIARTKDVRVRFLVLDEGMANLSPANRDNMTRTMNRVLRKIFEQVLMTSHVELRDIFDTTVVTEVVDGASTARVCAG